MRTVALGMCAIGLLSSAHALACGGDWYPEVEVDPRIHGVLEAEKAVAKGNYVAAAGSVVRMMPHIKTLQAEAKRDPLIARAERVLAVAIERSNGKLALEQEVPSEYLDHWQGKTAADHDKNMAWSVSTLRHELTLKKDDPGIQTELGEALSKLDSGADEARALLESLAARDLVATPEGYRALAQLRSEKGDAAGQKLAMKRCESMAATSKVCETSAPRAS
jgi:predicted Zn-dependent protease